MVVLTASLVISKYVLDALLVFDWPVLVYVTVLATVGYGPSVWWCWYASRRWGTGRVAEDLGLTPRFADIGWGPVIWLAAIGCQLAIGAVVVGLGVPISNNTDGINELQADRTYVVSLVITAVVAAPFVEELVFRGLVLRGLLSRMSAVLAVVVQALLFGAAHVDPVRGVGNVGLVMVLTGVGIALGAAAYLLRRIGPTIVAHAIFNGVVLVIVLTGVVDRLDDAGSGAAGGSVGAEQVTVVDEADVAEPDRGGDADPAGNSLGGLDPVDLLQRGGVEDRVVLVTGERFGVDHSPGGGEHLGH